MSEIKLHYLQIYKYVNVLKNGICFAMGDIRCHGNLVYLVLIFLKFHTLIVICNNRDIRYFCGSLVIIFRISC